jgi:hypothetical protein
VQPAEVLKQHQQITKEQHDKSAKELPALRTGDQVFMRTNDEKHWSPGSIVNHHQSPRSYIVNNGQNLVRRNRVHLKNNQTKVIYAEPDVDEQTPHKFDRANQSIPDQLDPDTSPEQNVHATPARRSQRANKGVLPSRYQDFDMH